MLEKRLGVSTLTWVTRPLTEAVARAHELGFPWIDLGLLNGWSEFGPEALDEDFHGYADPLRSVLETTGVKTASINAGFGDTTDPITLLEQAHVLCRAAKAFRSAAGVTLPAPPLAWEADRVRAYLQPLYDVFAGHGVPLMLETHFGQWTQHVDRAEQLLEWFPELRLTLDFSHYIIQGLQPADWESLLPRAGHCHIRPCGEDGWETVQTEPSASSPLVFDSVRQMLTSGYGGLFSLEIIEGFNSVEPETAAVAMRDLVLRLEPKGE